MNDLRTHLQQGDPLKRDRGLPASDIEEMRRRLLTTPARPQARVTGVLVLTAATTAVVIAAGLLINRPIPPIAEPVRPASSLITGPVATVRQLQFSGPSGTRVIWTFNPNLEVR